MRLLVLVLIAALALTAAAACGDDDDDDDAGGAEGDVARYCEITNELEERGDEIFGDLGSDASEEEFAAAERELVESSEDDFEELVDAAPEDLRDDVEVLVDGIRQRGGLDVETEVSEEEASAAEERVLAFEEAECED